MLRDYPAGHRPHPGTASATDPAAAPGTSTRRYDLRFRVPALERAERRPDMTVDTPLGATGSARRAG